MRLLLPLAIAGVIAYAADDPGVTAFTKNLEEFVKVRDAASRKAGGAPTNGTPEEIQKYEQRTVAEIRLVRDGAKPGDVFVPQVRPLFYRILKENFAGPDQKEAREVARQGNPKRGLEPGEVDAPLKVNAIYPKNAPLSTVPPLLLLQLPKLPKDIEYRFSGNTLLLLDNRSNLIIDFLKGAAPGL